MTLIERYFRALGWEFHPRHPHAFTHWTTNIGEEILTKYNIGDEAKDLPNILEHFPSFRQFVIEEMHNRNITLEVNTNAKRLRWKRWGFKEADGRIYEWPNEIKDNDIPRAAVEAACEYLEKEKEDEAG